MKTYTEIRMINKDVLFLVNDNGTTFKMIMRFNSISSTYSGVELQAWDDTFSYMVINMWVFSINYSNIKDVLKTRGFTKTEPTQLQELLYREDITHNQN